MPNIQTQRLSDLSPEAIQAGKQLYSSAPMLPAPAVSTAAEHVTKEGIEVKPGQVWRDLDKRMPNRHCKVVAVELAKAVMRGCHSDGSELLGLSFSTTTKISICRMHKSSTGWALVQDAN